MDEISELAFEGKLEILRLKIREDNSRAFKHDAVNKSV